MKKLFLISILTIVMLTSCSTMYVQVVDIRSAEAGFNPSELYKYADNNVTIYYNFWAQNGEPGFVIENNTNQVIYIDLSKSFYINGKVVYDYFLNRTFSSSRGVESSVAAANKFLATGATGKKSVSVSYGEKPVIAIPANSQRVVSEYSILHSPLQDSSVEMFPGFKKPSSYKYSNNQMPEFSNVITYRIGEKGEDKTIINKFYIIGFSNYKLKYETGDKAALVRYVETEKAHTPNSFYILYSEPKK